ncbi:hypothetical protein [Streptomyces sp. NPDC054849]
MVGLSFGMNPITTLHHATKTAGSLALREADVTVSAFGALLCTGDTPSAALEAPAAAARQAPAPGNPCRRLGPRTRPARGNNRVPAHPYAHGLCGFLRELDQQGCDLIIASLPLEDGMGLSGGRVG